jgi:AcrR family transcriptional regulator
METLTKRGRPRNEEMLAQRREDILVFATQMFSQYGYQRTDVQLIADGLGLGKGTIYRYFSTKEELFLCTVDRGMAGLNAHIMRSASGENDPIRRIAMALKGFLGYFDENPQLVELLIQERAEFRDRENPTFKYHREKNIGPWHELLEQLMDQGRVRRMAPELITQVMSDAMYGKIFTTYFNSKRRSFESQIDEVLAVVFGGILADSERHNLNAYLTESHDAEGNPAHAG